MGSVGGNENGQIVASIVSKTSVSVVHISCALFKRISGQGAEEALLCERAAEVSFTTVETRCCVSLFVQRGAAGVATPQLCGSVRRFLRPYVEQPEVAAATNQD